MSTTVRSFHPTFGAKKSATVGTSASAAQLVATHVGGPMQVLIANYSTDRVAFRFGASTVVADINTDPSIPAGGYGVITVSPPVQGPGDIYMSVVGAAAAGTFEATPGQGI